MRFRTRRDALQLSTAIALFLGTLISANAVAVDYFVSADGNDAWSGELAAPNDAKTDGPFRTLAKASDVLQPGDTCYLREGVYRETLRPARSGKKGAPITFARYQNEKPVISGADRLTGWKKGADGVYVAPLAWDLKDQNQLFVDGEMMTEARWPNSERPLLHPTWARMTSGTKDSITDPNLPGGEDAWKGALLWCAGGHRWICWAATVDRFDAKTKTLHFKNPQDRKWYIPKKGNPYVLMGLKIALDAPGEWWFDRDAKQMHLKPPTGVDLAKSTVAAKRRLQAIDLSGRSHIRIVGLGFRAGGILTDKDTTDVELRGLRGRYIGHSYRNDISSKASVLIAGKRIVVRRCEFSISSGSVVRINGADNQLINCLVTEGDYGAKWKGTLAVAGRRHYVGHNTIRESGRDLVTIHGLMESVIEHNDFSNPGRLTQDLGMIYGHNTDFMGTVIRYNRVHDNLATGWTAGIYFDHLSHNVLVHHNVVWNVPGCPIQINNPSYFNLVYNNTCFNTGRISTFDHSRRNDLFGTRMHNNIVNQPIKLPEHVAKEHNLVDTVPPLADPTKQDFRPKNDPKIVDAGMVLPGVTGKHAGAAPDLGAFELGEKPWRTGHDFTKEFEPNWDRPEVAYANAIVNACFELDSPEHWKKVGDVKVELIRGNDWGNNWAQGEPHGTGTSKRELKFSDGPGGPGGSPGGVEQRITGLHPGTAYTLTGWARVADGKLTAVIGVKDHGGKPQQQKMNSTAWTRLTVPFTTGTNATSATVFLKKATGDPGAIYFDNLGLPRVPAK